MHGRVMCTVGAFDNKKKEKNTDEKQHVPRFLDSRPPWLASDLTKPAFTTAYPTFSISIV
jgi:hypothetical protein